MEIHPYFSQRPLVEFCQSRNIVVTAYSPLGTGAVIDGSTVVGNSVLKEIGDKYGKSSAQVAICWLASRGLVVIPKSVTPARVLQNREVKFGRPRRYWENRRARARRERLGRVLWVRTGRRATSRTRPSLGAGRPAF